MGGREEAGLGMFERGSFSKLDWLLKDDIFAKSEPALIPIVGSCVSNDLTSYV